MNAYTQMGASSDCCAQHTKPRQVHTKGMIGGGWRVDGFGGPDLILDVHTAPKTLRDCLVRIVIDRDGHIVEIMRRDVY